MITIHRWSTGDKTGQWLDGELLRQRVSELRRCADVLWIDLDNPTEEEEGLVFREFFPIHPLSLEDITRLRREPGSPPHLPKVEEFPDYLFVIVNPLVPGLLGSLQAAAPHPSPALESPSTQLSAVLTQTVLMTHHYQPILAIEGLKTLLNKHERQADRGPDYLFHLILDGTVDEYAPVLDHFDDSLDDIEVRLLKRPAAHMLGRLLQLKRHIIRLRKTLVYEREVLARLIRGEFALIDDREIVYYRNVYDHLVRFSELIESSREMVSDLMQTHLAAVSNRLNEVMKALAMISTVVLPMSLVAGIYGMNFEESTIPNFHSPTGFAFAMALMVLTGIGAFAFFRWRKWI